MTPEQPSLDDLVRLADAGRDRAVVLIDGGAGSGKTTLGIQLRDSWRGPVHLVSLDDVYPGWSGLADGSRAVHTTILRGLRPGYRRWDWALGARAEWVPLDPDRALIIEGCGALTPHSSALATLRIWCHLDADTRRDRAIARDGDTLARHWDDWAAQEAEHWRRHRPWELADLRLAVGGSGQHQPPR